jgi:hypothetical protein
MTWMRQVIHVFGRDLRRTWVLLVVYAELLCLTVARALEWQPAMHAALAPVGWITAGGAVLATVRVVLADETTRADAFWAVLPLQASVVAASKLLYVLSLLTAYGAAMLVIRSAWALGSPSWSGAEGLYPVLTLILLGAALATSTVGTVTRVGALVAGTLGLAVFIRFVVDMPPLDMAASIWWTAVTVLAIGCTAFVVRRYRRRETSLLTRGAALGTGVIAMLFPVVGVRSMPGVTSVEYDPAHSLDSIALTLPVTKPLACDGSDLTVPIAVGAPLGWRVEMMRPTLDVTRDDGAIVSVSAPRWMQLAGGGGPLLPTDRDRSRMRVLGIASDMPMLHTGIVFTIPAAGTERLCGHIDRVALRMWVKTGTGVDVMRVPLRNSATLTMSGYRAHVVSQVFMDSSVHIRVRVSGMTDDATRFPELGDLSFALLNTARGQVVGLSDSRVDDATWTSALPGGLRHSGMTVDLELYDGRYARIGGLEAWRDSSVLLITAPKQEGRGWLRSPIATVP